MFLRSHLVARLPIAIHRLSCNSASSTSNSTSFLSTTRFVLSRRNSHAIDTSSQQLARPFDASLVWMRRWGGKNWEVRNDVKRSQSKHTNDNNSNRSSEGGQEPTEPKDPKRPGIVFYFFAISSLAISQIIFSAFITKTHPNREPTIIIPADAQEVDFDTFVKKYLKTGEIQEITFSLVEGKAMGTLREGAIIDGSPAECKHIVITPKRVRDKKNMFLSYLDFNRDLCNAQAEIPFWKRGAKADHRLMYKETPKEMMKQRIDEAEMMKQRIDEAKEMMKQRIDEAKEMMKQRIDEEKEMMKQRIDEAKKGRIEETIPQILQTYIINAYAKLP